MNCDACGEEIINECEVHQGCLTLCLACAGQAYYRGFWLELTAKLIDTHLLMGPEGAASLHDDDFNAALLDSVEEARRSASICDDGIEGANWFDRDKPRFANFGAINY